MLCACLVPPSERARDTAEDCTEVEVCFDSLFDAHLAISGGVDPKAGALARDRHAFTPARPAGEPFLT